MVAPPPKDQAQGLSRVWNATLNSSTGLKRVWQDEAAFRQEVVLGIAMLAPLLLLKVAPVEWVALTVVWLLILIVEVLNSAVEAAIDRIGPEWHDLSGKAKDLGSLAVTLVLTLGLIVWCYVAISAFSR